MALEVVLVLGLFAATLLPLVAWLRHSRSRSARFAAAIGWAAGAAALSWAVLVYPRPVHDERDVTDRPIEVRSDGYVSSRTCRSCHPRNYATWYGSYHRSMTQLATPEAVLGDFDRVEAWAHGERLVLERRGDEFWVERDDPDADGTAEPSSRVRQQVLMTTGSHHYQVYWVATGNTRKLAPLPIVYRIPEQRWVPRSAVFLAPPVDAPRDETGRWNDTCVHCHATQGQPRLFGPEEIDTQVGEFGIACESCHGPGEEHVRANGDPLRRYGQHFSEDPDPTIVNPENLPVDLASHLCARCHGITEPRSLEEWQQTQLAGFAFEPGQDLSGAREIVECCDGPDEGLTAQEIERNLEKEAPYFWSDGMVRIRGREFQGLLATPCYTAGAMSCLSCHAMHQPVDDPRPLEEWADDQLKPGMLGDRACLQCHESFADTIEEHTHHPASSPGSRCYNCHMPFTVFGLLKANRSHQVDSPDVAKSVETGRPNACNQCHLKETLAWAADALEEWYGTPRPELDEDQKSLAASVLWALRGDASQRALMAWSMGWEPAREASGDEWTVPYLSELLLDPYDAVRFIAYQSLREQGRADDVEYDYVGPEPQRVAAAKRVLRTWAATPPADPEVFGERVLIDAGGSVDWDAYERLTKDRDVRPIYLAE